MRDESGVESPLSLGLPLLSLRAEGAAISSHCLGIASGLMPFAMTMREVVPRNDNKWRVRCG